MGFSTELHSKPLHFFKKVDRVFQKEIQSFLEHTQLPLYTFQFVKETSESFLRGSTCFWWEHPSHFKSNWLVLNGGWEAVFVNPREPDHANSARIPLLRANVKQQGPFVLEVMLDTVERIVWVVDILSAKGVNCFDTMPFLERYDLAQKVVANCIQSHAVLQSCEVKMVPWKNLSLFSSYEPNEKCCVSFMSARGGERRHVWKKAVAAAVAVAAQAPVQQQPRTTNKKPVQQSYGFVEDEVVEHKNTVISVVENVVEKEEQVDKNHKKALAYKDPKGVGPDLYLLELMDGTQLGSLALRNMQMRIQLRKTIETKTKVPVSIIWYEPFNKYELKSILE
jgi:hypothetical protein